MGWYRRLRNLSRQRKLHRELDREMSFHIRERTDDFIASGMNPDDARRAALRRFGNYNLQRERTRDMDIAGWLESLARDIKYGCRMIRRNLIFSAVVVLSLAIGIGANATLFSLVDAILLRELPLEGANELVFLQWKARSTWFALSTVGTSYRDAVTQEMTTTSFSYSSLKAFRDQSGTLSEIFAYSPLYEVTFSADGQPELVQGQLVSGNYFQALRVRAAIGRTLNEQDELEASPVAVISHRYWQRRFAADSNVIGKAIVLNGVPLTIAGVTQEDFLGVQGFGQPTDISVPISLEKQLPSGGRTRIDEPWSYWVRILGRLKPGTHIEQVRAELEPVFHNVAVDGWNAAPAQNRGSTQRGEMPRLVVLPGNRGLTDGLDDAATILTPLAFIAGILLLIVCVNVANLLLARTAARQSELSVRLALGGGRGRLVRQLLTETVLLSVAAAAVGVVLAYWGKDVLVSLFPQSTTTGYDLRIDLRVLAFSVAVAVFAGILMGIAPALRATRENLNVSMKEHSRTLIGPRAHLSRTLLVAQIALSMILLIGAGLFARTVQNLRNVDVGFDTRNLLLFRMSPRALNYDNARIASLYETVMENVGALPGITATTFLDYPLVGNSGSSSGVWIKGMDVPANRRNTRILTVHHNFFDMLGVRLLAGRGLNSTDTAASPKVAVINEAMAHRLFGKDSPLGAVGGFGQDRTDFEIVGIVKDISVRPAREPVPPTIFLPQLQATPSQATFMVRTAGDPSALIPVIREALRRIDSNLPLYGIRTQEEHIETGFAIERMFARATTFFGGVAVVLSSIGLFGLMSYSVSRRTNEIGIRMALGARRADVVQLVMRQTFMLVFAGVIVGFAGSLAITRVIETMPFLFRVAAKDPLTFISAILTMIAVGCLAAYLPAKRASRVHPSIALRCE
jgi:predicted permease